MEKYENDVIPFRLIDSRGLDFSIGNRRKIQSDIKKWSKAGIKEKKQDSYIHVIWYCLDASSKRVSDENLNALSKISKVWKNIPIIIVFTKSYFEEEIPENEMMIQSALSEYNRGDLNVKGIVSVVAKIQKLNENVIIEPRGLDLLIEKTNNIVPMAVKLNEEAVDEFSYKIKRSSAYTLMTVAATSATTIGAVPIPMADAPILITIQSGLVTGIRKIYGIKRSNDAGNQICEIIVQTGVTTFTAKTILSSLKAIPGLNIAASVLNAIVAGTMTVIVGEVAVEVMEKIAKGKIDASDLDWITRFAESEFQKKVKKYIKKLGKEMKNADISKVSIIINDMVRSIFTA